MQRLGEVEPQEATKLCLGGWCKPWGGDGELGQSKLSSFTVSFLFALISMSQLSRYLAYCMNNDDECYGSHTMCAVMPIAGMAY